MTEVDRVLAQRSNERAARGPGMASLIAALALHGLLAAAVLLVPRLTPPPPPLEFVPVQVIPAQALGVRKPAPARSKPAPEPPKPDETPAEQPAAAPTPEPEAAPPLPDEKPKKPEPAATPAPKATPAPPVSTAKTPPTGKTAPPAPTTKPGTASPEETGDQPGRRGGPNGTALGSTAFGSEIAGLDNPDFTYGYYIDRLLSLIDAQWVRPPIGDSLKTVIAFTIQRDGSVADLRVAQSSGYNSFDLAALRAVQNASPFPPLPRAYRHDTLGVNLIVR